MHKLSRITTIDNDKPEPSLIPFLVSVMWLKRSLTFVLFLVFVWQLEESVVKFLDA
jgi:hypothetical protein